MCGLRGRAGRIRAARAYFRGRRALLRMRTWGECTMSTELPGVEELIALVLGDLDPSQAALLEDRLTRDPEARRLLDHIRALVETLRHDDGVTPPDGLVRTVKDMMAAPAPGRPSLRELVATLVFDSLGKVAIPGFRGAASVRTLAFTSEAADIDLQICPTRDDRHSIRGQVTALEGGTVFEVAITRPGEIGPLALAPVDSRGMFGLESPAGVFDLRVRVGDAVVTLPAISVE